MKRIFDFQCDKGHTHEAFVDSEVRSKPCPECDLEAKRLISTPRVMLEGTTGSFPGAAMQWERKRKQKLDQERKRNEAF